jgi:hypothetical protein
VPDQKPPRLSSGERDVLRALLQYQRESFLRKVEGTDEEAARTPIVESGTSLLWLVKHLTLAERVWILQRFAGEDIGPIDGAVGPDDSLDSALRSYRQTWTAVDTIVNSADLEDACSNDEVQPPVNLRWVLMHLLEETARHAGHADILRELIDGSTGR